MAGNSAGYRIVGGTRPKNWPIRRGAKSACPNCRTANTAWLTLTARQKVPARKMVRRTIQVNRCDHDASAAKVNLANRPSVEQELKK